MVEKKWDNKHIKHENDNWFRGDAWDFERTKTGKKHLNYRCRFQYKDFLKKDYDYQFQVDWADWLNYIDDKEKELESIENSSKNPETKETLKTELDVKPFNPDQGDYNKILSKLKQIETDFKKSVPEKVKDAKEIMAEIEKKHREIVEKMDNKLDKLQDNKNNLSQQFQKAFRDNNKSQMAVIKVKMKEVDDQMTEIIESKLNVPDKDWVEKYFQASEADKNKHFFQKINWKAPRTYYLFGGALVGTLALIYLIYWIIRKYFYGS